MPARFTVIAPELIRLEWRPAAGDTHFVDAPSLVFNQRNPAWAVRTVHDADGPQTVDTARIRLRYTPDGRSFHQGNLQAEFVARASSPAESDGSAPAVSAVIAWHPGLPDAANLGGTIETLDGVRGRVPLGTGLLSRTGWTLIDDSRTHLLRDGGGDGWPAQRETPPEQLDWYLFGYGEDYRAALRAFTAAAGRAPLPPKHVLGSWYSRYWPYTSDEFRAIVDEYARHGFPLDVMVLDMDWHRDGWTGWSWNRALLPDAEKLLQDLHERGVHVTLNLHPADGVGPHEDAYGGFMRALGEDPESKRTVPFDAGSRRYMGALFDHVLTPLERDGVDFWWVDWQQERDTRSLPGLTNLRWLNHLFFKHTSEGAHEGRRGISFSRWAGLGDHRHPIHFSGDSHTGWAMLDFIVPFTATAGNVGCFFWSHDVGGHFGPRVEEAMARWVQFSALSASLRLHSARSPRLDRRPWTHETKYCESMRRAFSLRAALMPTIYTAARQCYDESVPLIRPMYLDHGDDERAYDHEQQYMLGDFLLCAPVTMRGAGERCVGMQAVWFPEFITIEGRRRPVTGWRNWLMGERFEPGTEQVAGADIDETPVFVPEGAPVFTAEPGPRMHGPPPRRVVVRCFPGADGSAHEAALYEDDGESRAALEGEGGFARTTARVEWGRPDAAGWRPVRIELQGAKGGFAGALGLRRFAIELAGVEEVRSARAGGEAVLPIACAGAAAVRIEAAPADAREAIAFEAEFLAADVERLASEARDRRVQGAGGATGEIDAGAAAALRYGVALRRHGANGLLFDSRDLLAHGPGEAVQVELIERQGTRETVVERFETQPSSRRAGRVGLPQGELPEPPLGLAAERLLRARVLVRDGGEAEEVLLERVVARRTRPLTAWRLCAPLPFDPARRIDDQRFAPELVAGAVGAASIFEDGRDIPWRTGRPSDRWPLDVFATLGDGNVSGLAYAATWVRSPAAQRARLEFSAGDRIEIFAGSKVFSQDGWDTHESEREHTAISLEAGWNLLLFKFGRGGGGWGLRAAIASEHDLEERGDPP